MREAVKEALDMIKHSFFEGLYRKLSINPEDDDIITVDMCLEPIIKDLEVLDILKRIVKIVEYSKYPITSPDDQLVILSGGEIKNVEDYDKIKEWLENDR